MLTTFDPTTGTSSTKWSTRPGKTIWSSGSRTDLLRGIASPRATASAISRSPAASNASGLIGIKPPLAAIAMKLRRAPAATSLRPGTRALAIAARITIG